MGFRIHVVYIGYTIRWNHLTLSLLLFFKVVIIVIFWETHTHVLFWGH